MIKASSSSPKIWIVDHWPYFATINKSMVLTTNEEVSELDKEITRKEIKTT